MASDQSRRPGHGGVTGITPLHGAAGAGLEGVWLGVAPLGAFQRQPSAVDGRALARRLQATGAAPFASQTRPG